MADWKEVFGDAIAAASDKLGSGGKKASDYLQDVAAAQKKSMESILRAFADGRIDRATMEAELEDEKRALRTELLAFQVIGKKAAQDAANAFFDVIRAAATAGIEGLL